MVNNQNRQIGVVLTLGHLKLVLFVAWLVGGLTTLTWLAVIQFLPAVTYWQVSLPYILLYSLVLTEEIARGFITKG